MNRSFHLGLVLAGAAALATGSLPALAASSAASSASDSASDSVGASSKSITQSSNSSSGDRKTAAGDYKVIEMAEAEGQPGMLRLRLQAAADETNEFFLTLPRQAALNGHVATGDIVRANERPYGLEFAAAADNKAFFLVVDDDWHKELQSRPVTL
ncbi:hypothetical protein SNE35_10105 [Paucibacter sp. R3-3]|uniref:Uncharacterized protein n=1 Tax=Roseateles agri TaxID=3098619 RepID=A0ABU5DF10_9BURK|nr:hypothetical protein [Paucibacter sp. R3-3]MDY0744861.1 hypothetical protein [Paucibacter sp. R3-3]